MIALVHATTGSRRGTPGQRCAPSRCSTSGPGQLVLNVGAGTGRDHVRIREAVGARGMAVVLDISTVMLRLARTRTGSPAVQGDARRLSFQEASFDRLLCTYVLDLIPAADLPVVLQEFRRVLKPGGRMTLATLTEGVSVPSRLLVSARKALYAVSPVICAGCRPLLISSLVRGGRIHHRAPGDRRAVRRSERGDRGDVLTARAHTSTRSAHVEALRTPHAHGTSGALR